MVVFFLCSSNYSPQSIFLMIVSLHFFLLFLTVSLIIFFLEKQYFTTKEAANDYIGSPTINYISRNDCRVED